MDENVQTPIKTAFEEFADAFKSKHSGTNESRSLMAQLAILYELKQLKVLLKK